VGLGIGDIVVGIRSLYFLIRLLVLYNAKQLRLKASVGFDVKWLFVGDVNG